MNFPDRYQDFGVAVPFGILSGLLVALNTSSVVILYLPGPPLESYAWIHGTTHGAGFCLVGVMYRTWNLGGTWSWLGHEIYVLSVIFGCNLSLR